MKEKGDYFYDSKNRLILTLQHPQGKSNWRYYCSYVAYAYDGTLPAGSTFTSQSSAGRVTTKKYGNTCLAPGTSPSTYISPSYGPPGYIETYSYHPAGGVTDKELLVTTSIGAQATLDAYYTYNTAGQVATTSYPTMGSLQDPNTYLFTPTTFTYAYDTMARPTSLKFDTWNPYWCNPSGDYWAKNATYDYAGRMSSLQYWDGGCDNGYMTESKTWNASGQLASVAWSGGAVTGSISYSYSATQNNGQITQVVDTVSGETISYQYDQLKRLISASSTPNSGSTPAAWTQTFQYDGFGNLTAKTLNGTTTPIAVNAATNQLTNAYYDANGNMTSGTGSTFTYDVSNRIATATATSGGLETYEYAPDNKRIHRVVGAVDEWTFYGAQGEKLGVYTLSSGYDGNGNPIAAFIPLRTSVWFAGKLIYENGAVNLDRLGTNRASGARFLPFGEELTSTSNDRTKFATYSRDSYTGLDYADQRFYASTYGRFNTPDPYQASGIPSDPGSWNRYSYTQGDPVNRIDPTGRDWCNSDWWDFGVYADSCGGYGGDDPGGYQPTEVYVPPVSGPEMAYGQLSGLYNDGVISNYGSALTSTGTISISFAATAGDLAKAGPFCAAFPEYCAVAGAAIIIYAAYVYLPVVVDVISQRTGSFIDRWQTLAADLKKCEAITDYDERAKCVDAAYAKFKGIGKPN